MKRTDSKLVLVIVAVATTVISLIISSMIFNSPKNQNLEVPVVETLEVSLPDIKNDPNYNTFLNDKALDATVPIQVGGNQSPAPFNQ